MVFHIISAALMEVEALLDNLNRQNIAFLYHPLGIGCLEAAKNAPAIVQKILEMPSPSIYLGTCGVFSSFETSVVYAPSRVLWLPTCERFGLSYRVNGTEKPIDIFYENPANNASEATAICCPNISLAGELNLMRREPKKIFLENLELYSFLMSAKALRSTVKIYLASTNKVGQSAHEEWLKNHEQAHKLLAEFALNSIKTLAH